MLNAIMHGRIEYPELSKLGQLPSPVLDDIPPDTEPRIPQLAGVKPFETFSLAEASGGIYGSEFMDTDTILTSQPEERKQHEQLRRDG